MKKLIAVLGILAAAQEGQALAATFDVANGQTLTTAQTLASGQSGTIETGGKLSLAGSAVAVSVTGNATIQNYGMLLDTGTGRAIRDNTGGLTLTLTNHAGALIQTADADVIQMNKANSNVTVYNYGTMTSLNASAGGSQAIDFNAITTGSNVLYNYSTGVLQANEADAVRPGVNGFVYNDGLIKSTNNPGSTDGSDGIDAQTNSGITVINATTGTATTAGTGIIEGARHGITGGNTDVTTSGAYVLNVTNNLGGTIQGDNGSGINIDGFNAKEVVTVVNHGTITGNGVSSDGDGVDVDGLVNITNTGTIQSLHAYDDASEGVTVGGGTIDNSGTIAGLNSATNADGTTNTGVGRGITLAGIDKDPTTGLPIPIEGIYGNTSVTNTGLIRGQTDSGIAVTGAPNAFTVNITNLAGGTIEGGGATAAAIATGGNNATVIDYGTITADSSNRAVDLGSGNSSLQILGGAATVNGNISGGSGSSALTIAPGAGNSFSYAGDISNFSSVAIGAGTVTLSGINTYTGATTVTGGTLSVAADTNLGATSSTLTLDGGTLQVTGTAFNSTARNIALGSAGGSFDIADAGNTFTLSQALGGTGSLTKLGSGTLVLSGANTYTGGTTINAGTLQGNSNSLQGNIVDNAALAFDQTTDGTYSGIISGNGTLTKSGSGTLTLGGANSYTGGTTINAGSLQGSSTSLQGNIVDNAALAFDQDTAGTYSGVVSGSGSLSKFGGGTLTLSGANSYTGGTTINAGTLQGDTTSLQGKITNNAALVFNQAIDGTFAGTLAGSGSLTKAGSATLTINGGNPFTGATNVASGMLIVGDDSHATASLGGNVTVASSATLGGIGSVGNLNLLGTISPGTDQGIGNLTINGNAVLQSGSSYRIDASPNGSSDRIVVGGSVSLLGGSALALAQTGAWAPSTTYTVLTATGSVNGTFGSVSSNFAFLTPSLSYTTHAVNLTLLRNDIGFADIAQTPNQRATAGALDAVGSTGALYGSLVTLDAANARAAFNQLSGESYASTKTALIDDSRYVRDAINRHLIGASNSADGVQNSNGDGVTAWTSAWDHSDDHDSTGNASRVSDNGGGLLVGADLAVNGNTRFGAVAGYSENTADVGDRNASARTNSTSLGIYGSTALGAFALRGGADYAWQDVDSTRRIAFGNYTDRLSADYHARTAQAFVEGGYRVDLSQSQQLEPFLNLARVQLQTDGAHEGGGAAALDVAGDHTDVNTATLGLRDTWLFDTAAGGIRTYASLGFQQGWGDLTPTTTTRFASGSDSFTISGVPVAQHALAANAGVSFPITRNATIDASYLGQFARHASDGAVRFSLQVQF